MQNGRPQKTAARRVLDGSRTRPRHRPEPEIPGTPALDAAPLALPPPPELTAADRRYWDQFAPLLAGARILTPADLETVADYCRCCVRTAESLKRLRAALRAKVPDPRAIRVWDTQAGRWMLQKTKLASELGLTPAGRTRVAWQVPAEAAAAEKPLSQLAQLQAAARALRRPVRVAATGGS